MAQRRAARNAKKKKGPSKEHLVISDDRYIMKKYESKST